MSDWENEVVIQITEQGAENTNRALKEVTRTFQDLKKLSINPLQMKVGQNSFADAFSPKAVEQATGALHNFGIEYERMGKVIKSPLSGGADRFADAFTKAGSGLDQLRPKIDASRNSFSSAAQAVRIFRTLIIATGIERFAASIFTGTDALINLENKIKVTAKAGEDLGFTMSRLGDIANQNRISIDAVATVYSRTARSVENLGVSQSSTLEFTKVLTQAVAVGGSTAIESSQAMIQLSQGLASGTLKGDELRSVLEQLPVVSKLIADQMGVTTGELRKLGAEGKLLAEDVFAAIINGGDEMEKKFAEMTPTFEQSAEVLHNKWIMGLEVFQPLVLGTAKALGWFTERWANLGDAMEEVFKIWIRHRDDNFFTRIGAVFTDQVGKPGDTLADVVRRKQEERDQARIDEDMIQKGNAMADMFDLAKHPHKPDVKKHKEGGLTFQQLVEKMKQEQEVASQTPFESDVTKEFFQKMGELKKSTRENLIAGAGKGGKADEQLQQLQSMIRLEHELAEAQKFVRYWDEKIAEEREKRAKAGIAAGQHERDNLVKAREQIEATNRAIEASLDSFNEYNNKLRDFDTFLHSHPDQVDKVTVAVEKMGTAYQTFAPIFTGIGNSIADAAASSIVFGDNLSNALKKIGLAAASDTLSAFFKIGIGALFGTPMPGINGGNTLTPVAGATPVSKAMGGFVPGFDSGGYTGHYGRGNVAGVVHGQEFVVNANATAQNRAMLESMNAGRPVSSGKANVVVHNYAGAQVSANMNGQGELEIMVRQAVAEQAPGVVATDLHNPNGRIGKVLRQRYEVQRRN